MQDQSIWAGFIRVDSTDKSVFGSWHCLFVSLMRGGIGPDVDRRLRVHKFPSVQRINNNRLLEISNAEDWLKFYRLASFLFILHSISMPLILNVQQLTGNSSKIQL